MAGRRPKPTELKELLGNPGRRPLNRLEPKPEGRATCPRHLSKEARREWRRVAGGLERMGLLKAVDRAALAGYCVAWARHVEAEIKIAQYGMMVKTPNGHLQQSPFITVSNRAMDLMRQFAGEFGMTPSSRSRIVTEDAHRSEIENRAESYFDEQPDSGSGRSLLN